MLHSHNLERAITQKRAQLSQFLQTAGIIRTDALVFARSIQTLRGQRAASTQIQLLNQAVASD
jgi:hypothetical protein